jgi:hypothetical protein
MWVANHFQFFLKLRWTHPLTRLNTNMSCYVDNDRAGVPDLSVRWIISIGGGGDSRDPTTNEQVVAP